MAKVLLSKEAREAVDRLSVPIHGRVLRIFDRLRKWPDVSGAKALRRQWAGHYRMRTGDYRVVFRVQDDKILVVAVGHRDRFYED